jgi:hypothetical protein
MIEDNDNESLTGGFNEFTMKIFGTGKKIGYKKRCGLDSTSYILNEVLEIKDEEEGTGKFDGKLKLEEDGVVKTGSELNFKDEFEKDSEGKDSEESTHELFCKVIQNFNIQLQYEKEKLALASRV